MPEEVSTLLAEYGIGRIISLTLRAFHCHSLPLTSAGKRKSILPIRVKHDKFYRNLLFWVAKILSISLRISLVDTLLILQPQVIHVLERIGPERTAESTAALPTGYWQACQTLSLRAFVLQSQVLHVREQVHPMGAANNRNILFVLAINPSQYFTISTG
jgi:hypothetical protein